MYLDSITGPADLRELSLAQVDELAGELREFIVEATAISGGHLGSNLGVVEITLALHRVFDSPRDAIVWDTGHQAYVHKLLTGRREGFSTLRQAGGLSGYPSREESEHDWVENSHASTALSWADGLATAAEATGSGRRVVAVVGDGAMTGGMAYEALNNLGHSGRRVIIVLNDNGRSYAPTVSRLSTALTRVRLNPSYMRTRAWAQRTAEGLPVVGDLVARGVAGASLAMRELVAPHAFFEALGVRYTGPIDGHDVGGLERALRHAAEYDGGPIVIHVVTQKGKGYSFAEDDDEKNLHDVPVFDPVTGPVVAPGAPITWTEAFTEALLDAAAADDRVHALTAAMPGPTGLLPFQARFPDRFRDVGIAEQHAVTAAAGMAMGGLRPVVALYSTFLSRAFDQANLDVGLHAMPVVFCLDRAGITGDDGASHHGVLDLALLTKVPGMTVLAPSSAQEVAVMLRDALTIDTGPVAIRWPKGTARQVEPGQVGSGLFARQVRRGDDVCFLAVGRMVEAAETAAELLQREQGVTVTVWDVRSVKPLDRTMLVDAARHALVVTVEDGIREGGAGTAMADAIAGLDEARRCPPVVVLGTPLEYIPQGKPLQILANLGLDGAGIAAAAAKALQPSPKEEGEG